MKSIESAPLRGLQSVAFISPHPDDVELCCGILIRRLICSNVKVFHYCVTEGAPSSEILLNIGRLPENYDRLTYKSIRRQETIDALNILGVNFTQINFLNYPDLECHRNISSLVSDFRNILRNVDSVLCCPFEGGHPDHDICRFALAVALDSIKNSVRIFEYASYNNLGYQIFQNDLPDSFAIKANSEEREIKRQVAKIFVSQGEEIKQFKTNMEYFRSVETASVLNDYTSYSLLPYYEQFAFSGSVVLEEIKKYLNSDR